MANQLQTSLPRQAGENEVSWLTRIIKAIKTDIEYIASLFNKTYSGIFINGDGDTVTVERGLIVSVEAPPIPPSFKLTWNDIGNAMYTTVGDYNAEFGSDFTTLTVDGNDQLLTGNSTTFAIPNEAFKNNTNLVAVDDTAESCTMLGDSAFNGCTNITTVSFPACASVGVEAFASCTALTTVSFPACTSIGTSAFYGCTSITTVSFPACTSILNFAFAECNSLITVSFPACTSVGIGAFEGCTSITTVSFPACASVGVEAFASCTALTTVSFPACTSIGTSAFEGCTTLTTVSFPACTSVNSNAFASCTALTTVSLPLCEDLGGTTGDDNVFTGISGNTITLTIAASRETCDGGNPDGDIVYLAANNTATINYV